MSACVEALQVSVSIHNSLCVLLSLSVLKSKKVISATPQICFLQLTSLSSFLICSCFTFSSQFLLCICLSSLSLEPFCCLTWSSRLLTSFSKADSLLRASPNLVLVSSSWMVRLRTSFSKLLTCRHWHTHAHTHTQSNCQYTTM